MLIQWIISKSWLSYTNHALYIRWNAVSSARNSHSLKKAISPKPVTDYQYDAAGRLSHLTRDKRQVLFHYDLRGNLTLIRAGGESGVSEHHFQFSACDKL
ncbi:RHS repeat domain-containing protein [Vibrio cincinnatiensis]|uniref:RHS repeat domain-containing protein n=1 Tax=Vibrio cincinnatiensis TaxID=675 RepID=UPI001EDE08E9|nr:RHS repeat domain-containing protein [Vibrio cincinnatiensis]MCG3727675.1 hypothetical protein [Vibrio cincinnatiensis]MCG3734535.1 hypothetical protein [Vibrio cincinnatiensis]MCG3741635.1 hypothetical protein [Vibrio cincinnatiensis]MCG3745239.1 hypothetical protein [Vibrio cincinnatiensis]